MEVPNGPMIPGVAGNRFYHPKVPWGKDFFAKLFSMEWYSTSTDIARNRIRRGITHVDRREFDQAIEEFSASIQVYNDNPVAFFERGRAYWHTGRFQEAADDLQAVVICKADGPRWLFHTYSLLGDSLRRIGKYDRAILNLNVALNYHADGQVYLSRGRARLENNDRDRAVEDFNEAIRLDSGITASVPVVPEG